MFVNRLLLCQEVRMTSRDGSPQRASSANARKHAASLLNDRELAANQRRTRRQHAQERAQDYVEGISDLIAAFGEARVTDLAKSLGVTHVTVIRTVERLQREGLVTTQPYRSIFLTEAARKLAAKAKAPNRSLSQRHLARRKTRL
jgi:Iron dependent repressor, N-terminal DNA binding domain